MIRPVTIVTFLLAGASGLYVYQSKHEVQLLDHAIEQTVHETIALRAQSRLLATNWEMLNNTDTLRQFSDTYQRNLKSITPSQFTSLADLNNRLPAPQPEMHGDDEQKSPLDTEHQGLSEPVVNSDEILPVPPIPLVPPAPRPVEARAPEHGASPRSAIADSPSRSASEGRPPEPRQTELRPPEPRQAEPRPARVVDARPEAKVPPAPKPIVLAAPRTAPVPTRVNTPLPPMSSSAALIAAAGPYGGSLLGMARGGTPQAPRPLPVSTTYNAN